MTQTNEQGECQKRCWYYGGLAGAAVFLLARLFTDIAFFPALVAAVIVFTGVGFVLVTSWCSDKDSKAKPVSPKATVATTPAPLPASAPAEPQAEPKPEPKPAPQAPSEPTRSMVQPSAPLAGQTELAARKGTWRYEGAAEDAASASAPKGLTAPRDGGADDLKKIKGIGPKVETMLNDLGIYHYDQIAAFSDAELAWVDDNLKGFRGRASRDNWVAQAKDLRA